ncbi:hypothetical protein D3C76_1408160 [compost metagenome]
MCRFHVAQQELVEQFLAGKRVLADGPGVFVNTDHRVPVRRLLGIPGALSHLDSIHVVTCVAVVCAPLLRGIDTSRIAVAIGKCCVAVRRGGCRIFQMVCWQGVAITAASVPFAFGACEAVEAIDTHEPLLHDWQAQLPRVHGRTQDVSGGAYEAAGAQVAADPAE